MATLAPNPKITPYLWFAEKAVEAAELYVSLFPDSRMVSVSPLAADSPSGPAGSVRMLEFVLGGQRFLAIEAGPLDPFNRAVSFLVDCEDQAEVDRYWSALTAGGGQEGRCGWLQDRYGVHWQIVPKALGALMQRADPARARRVMEAMLGMNKLDVAGLEKAARGG
jgi:predicted 3-demethylubiquinone-9 3-methyltransferase (glyoxalase superfamily)